MLKRLKGRLDVFVIVAFLLPFIFYGGIFLGRSFGLECAAGVMGFKPPYQQKITSPNAYCFEIYDVGAYAYQHYSLWTKAASDYLKLRWPLWNQNNGIGVPLAANFISTVYFIPNILFAIPKNVFSFDLYFVLRMSVASLGMYLFLRSFKIHPLACLVGSLIVFLNGYVTHIPTISHLDVDILLPWIALLMNLAFSTKKIKFFVLLALVTGLSHLGGMPEASLFIALFFVAYSVFLSLFVTKKEDRLKFITAFFLSFVLGALIASILVIPGLEYITHSSSSHSLGSAEMTSVDLRNAIFWPFPRLFGGLLENLPKLQSDVNFGIWNLEYIGSLAFFSLVFSVFIIVTGLDKSRRLPLHKYYIFFVLFLFLLLSQYFGLFQNPIFTRLPGFSQTNFPKYSLTLINFLIGTIIVFGIHYLIEHKLKLTLIVSALLITVFTVFTYFAFKTTAVDLNVYSHFVKQLLFGVGIVFITIVAIFLQDKIRFKKTYLYFLIFLLAMIEFYVYIPNRGDLQRRNSFQPPPAINFLKARDFQSSRIFSPDYILYPDLSAIFDINDVRNLDALWPKNYYDYLKSFIVPDLDKSSMRFTGLQENGVTTEARFTDNVFFDLLSVKYILSYEDINAFEFSMRIRSLLDQVQTSPALRSDVFTIEGITHPVLFEHPPAKITLAVNKPVDGSYLYLYPAMSPEVFGDPAKGDGVRFTATVLSDSKVLFQDSLSIDPKNNQADQKWFEVKLGPFPDIKDFQLVLETDPLTSSAWDWAGWGGFQWDTELSQPKTYQFTKIYDAEMKIFENNDFIPRLHPINSIECAKTEENVLRQMNASVTRMRDLGIVLSTSCNPEQFATNDVSITNQSFTDQQVSFIYSSPHASYIVLSNDYYPGWKLKINGKEQPIDRVNYAFQGLRLPKGNNLKIDVVYDPLSFKIGLSLTALSLGFCIFVLISKYRDKRI